MTNLPPLNNISLQRYILCHDLEIIAEFRLPVLNLMSLILLSEVFAMSVEVLNEPSTIR